MGICEASSESLKGSTKPGQLQIGRWAGKRVLIQGDYAEDKDIPGWKGPRLSKLHSAMTPVGERKRKKDWRSIPVFADIAREACAFLEAACNVRYFEQEQICKDGDPRSRTYGQIIDRWTSIHSVAVKPVARHFGNCGIAEYVIADFYDVRDLEYLKRCGMQPEHVQRPPRSGDWHGFLPEEIPEGQHRVIVNLDTLEYIDPVKFGQAPTLAGMVTSAPKDRDLPILKKAAKEEWRQRHIDVAGGLFVMLCHPQRRGGGDIPANAEEMGGIDKERAKHARLFKGVEDVKGCWRGGHILGTGEIRYEDWPTTEEVLEKGTDIATRSSNTSSPSATIKPMTTKDNLISRLQNWKFVQAMSYADNLPENLRQVLVRLSDLWGDTGFSRGGVFETVLEYTVGKLIDDINTLPD